MTLEYPVDNLDDAYNACNPDEPLLKGESDKRYLDLTSVRNGETISILTTRIVRAQRADIFHKQLFTGHRGSGKSTELRCLKTQLENKKYFVVFLDVEKFLDLAEITYQDILLMMAKGILENLEDANIRLDGKYLVDLQSWFAEKVVSQVYSKQEEGVIKAEAEVGFDIPFLKLLSKLTGEIKSASGRREEIRQTLERELSVFIAKLNDLIDATQLKLKKNGFAGLVIIVDGLEKMYYKISSINQSNYADLFIHHAEQLNSPKSHIIYTVPLSLAFDSNFGDQFSDSLFIIPMIKYDKKDGRDLLVDLIAKRMKLDLFSHVNLLLQLIAMSGGSMRDLFRLIRLATEAITPKIGEKDVQRAIQTLVKEYDRLLKEEYIPLLKDVKENHRITVDVDRKYEQLLYLRLVHEFENGKRWASLHPALMKIEWLQDRLVGGINA